MVSTVKSRPNYYEMLGLTPSAAGDAIAQAFARATSVFQPHLFGGITELCVAYETLRDPIRRRAYDASIGLPPKPTISPVSRPVSAHFMQQPVVAAAPPEPFVEPRPRFTARVQRPPEASAKPPPRPAPPTERAAEPSFAPLPSLPTYDESGVGYAPIEWKRTGAIVGGLVAAAVLVGALTGWWSSGSAAGPEPAAPAAAAAPEEKAVPNMAELWGEPSAPITARRVARPRPTVPSRQVERLAQRAAAAETEVERQLIQPPKDLSEPTEADPLAPDIAPAPSLAVAAAMPLPHRTVARTLDRIGYRCGSVASASPVEGAAGVYTVNCTSGQSFQAKPVKGRYRFRRVARN